MLVTIYDIIGVSIYLLLYYILSVNNTYYILCVNNEY